MRNKIILVAIANLAVFGINQSANAGELSCPGEEILALADSCDKRYKGSGGSASCAATIQAPEGYFILEGDVKRSKSGTRHPSGGGPGKSDHEIVAKIPVFQGNVLSAASQSSRCSRSKDFSRPGRTCEAKAQVSAKAYPNKCLKKLMEAWTNAVQ